MYGCRKSILHYGQLVTAVSNKLHLFDVKINLFSVIFVVWQ